MIGLGSNRLSVCRRGGMSVTQAGKGGMKWLAGTGSRSPYSVQATAALKAQFPTQWPTIRDYGVAHPEIVGYMNAYAPEDAKIAYSLVEGIGWRRLNGDGASYLKLDILADSTDYEVFMDVTLLQRKSGTPYFICASTNSDRDHACNIYTPAGTTYNIWVGSLGSAGSFTPTLNQRYKHHVKVSGGRVLWTEETLGTILDQAYSGTPVNNNNFYVYTHIGNLAGRCNFAGGHEGWIKKGGEFVLRIVPFIRDGKRGMIDIINDRFYQNAGSGSFTISETPAS